MRRKELPAVRMPERVTFKTGPNGTRYAYLTTRAYRNAAGRPTSDEAAIGKVAPDGVALIPNQRYFELFPDEAPVPAAPVPDRCEAFGATAALSVLAGRLGVDGLLGQSAGGLAAPALVAASYMVCEGNAMCHVAAFCDESFTPQGERLDSQGASVLFSGLGFEQRTAFLRRWAALRQEDEYIAYDVTSLSTYSGGIEDAEWGHNRDGEDLCQVNLGMFFGEDSGLPVYYEAYQGSVLDKTHLPVMMASAKALGIGRVRFVFDRGFVTAGNIAYVAAEHLSFVSALPMSRLDAKAMVAEAAPRIRSSANLVDGTGYYAVSLPAEVEGAALAAHVFFSPYKAAGEEEAVYARVARREQELAALARDTKRVARRFREYFDVTLDGGEVAFSRDFAKIDAQLSLCGYFILITNDAALGAAGALAVYRGKDAVEKAFAGMKNHIDFKRMRTHGSATTDGKLFVGFVALILRSALRRALSAGKATASMSAGAALRELRKLKRVTYADGSVVHTAVTKAQREILEALDIEPEYLLAID